MNEHTLSIWSFFVLRKHFNRFLFFYLSLSVLISAQNSSCDAILSWVCGNGECIGINERCNGKIDCSDGSDETVTECISFQCREDKFRCLYGACVVLSAECNGVKVVVSKQNEIFRIIHFFFFFCSFE